MKKHKKLPALASRAAALFFALLLLSESTAANVGSYGVKIAQQPAPTPSVPLNAEQQKLYQQGVKLVEEAEELEKKETREASEQAINKSQQALKIAQKLGLREEEVNILAYIANLYNFIDEYKTAIEYLQQALKISRELKKTLIEASLLASIGINYNNINEPKEGLTYLEKAKSIFLANQEYRRLASTFNSIATIHMKLGDTKKALNYRNEALKLYREPLKDLAGEAYTLWRIGAIYSLSGEPKTALDYYEQALKIQRQRNDFKAEIEIIRDIAALQDKLGNAKNAVESLKEALKLQQQAGFNLSDQANTIADIGEIYAGQADYRTAIDYYQQAGKLFQQAGNTRMLSRTFVMIANVHKNFSGNYEKALEFVDKALELQIDDKDNYAFTLGQKADIHLSQANYQKALDEYNKTLELQRSIPNPRDEARILRDIAYVYRNLGDYKLSLETYNKALDIYKLTPNKTAEIRTLNSIASLYEWQDKYNEALQYYQKALSLLNKDDYQSEIQVIWGMTKIYTSLKDYPKALELANRALKLSKEKSYYEEFSLYALATVYRAKGDYQKSLDISHNLLAHYRKAGLRIWEAQMLGDMSVTYELQKNYRQAINILNEELKIRRELKDSKAEADALYGIAVNQRKLGNLNAALPNIEAAIEIIENIRSNVKNSDLRTSYFATVQNYYKFQIDLLMELHKKEPSKGYDAQAIQTSDRSRARGLVELLTEARANIRKGANPELLAEERRIQALIDGKEKVRFEIVNSDKIQNPIFKANAEKLQAEIDELLSQQKQLETKIRETSPQYANLKYPQPLTLPQIQQQLDKDTLLLQYSLGNERSFLWVVSPNSLDTYELPKKAEIEKSAINLFCLISKYSSKPPSATNKENPCAGIKNRQIDIAAKELSQQILAPVKDKLGKKRLVIVADGALQYIPFAALADLNSQPNSTPQEVKDKPKDVVCSNAGGIRVCSSAEPENLNYQPLLVNHEIVSLPSASAIAIQRQELAKRPPAPQALAILADPVYNANDERITTAQNKQLQKQNNLDLELERSELRRSADILNRDIWPRLFGTRTEAKTIFNLVPKSQGVQLLDFAANYTAATSSNLKQFQILHFATHGFVNDANPELSGIVLSLVNEQGKDIRGYLRLADLFNLDYPADLIVLSACETGLGKEIQGEGLVGLTRGLMYAGAERLVVSLWQVSDEGTSFFMQEFYQQMWQQNKTANQALRAAQLKMWEQEKWRNPNYWAAFTFLGEWR
ncbi:TPR domain protein [Calothrix sp. NIES-2100]|uniref:CHAT domain-containing tetratricopeptide repeat protein n=1 Tax=Calothrix sp. NIES-2100 TaxID=1954172 RepID=UPI000B602484|nr:TPR domain protein [Calothrix sp. NIES-2100]